MPVTMSQLTLPAFRRGLDALSAILCKAEAHATAKKIDETVLLQARLFPDMLPFVRQVQMACDLSKGAAARLGGVEVPSFPDTEATFAQLHDRIARTRDFIGSVAPAAIDGSETRSVSLKGRDRTLEFNGQDYLLGFVLPNFYFHLTTAYAILRHNGVEIGKMDFLGAIPLR